MASVAGSTATASCEAKAVDAAEKELARLKSKLAASQGDDLVNQAADVTKVLAATLEGADVATCAKPSTS